MSAKIVFVLCAQALLIQSAVSQCSSPATVAAAPGLGAPYSLGAGLGYNGLAAPYGAAAPALGLGYNGLGYNGLAYDGLAAGYAGNGLGCGYAQALDFTPTSGGGLPVSSASAIAPVGISVASDNVYEGALSVAGELPFVGTVAFENVLPTAGSGAVNHACGNGINAMASGPAAYGAGIAPAAYGAGIAPAAYGAGIAPAAYGAGIAPAAYGAGIAPAAYGAAIAPAAYGAGAGYGCGCGALGGYGGYIV